MKPDLEAALRAVESMAGGRTRPTRHHARPILLSLGESLLAGDPGDVAAASDRLRSLPQPLSEAWKAAVRDELGMACTEYVRSVDPQYLDHPRYDLEYTLEARRMLEARIRAAEHLGCPVDPAWASDVTRADARLEGRTRARGTNGRRST